MPLASWLALLVTAVWAASVEQRPLFSPASEFPVVGHGSGQVVFADLDSDGHDDLLTRHLLGQTVTVSIGAKDGRFRAPRPMKFDYPPADIKVGDLDEDGRLDLAVTGNARDFVDVFRGDGRGAFSRLPGSPFTVEETLDDLNKRTLHLIDLNADGHLDVATANGRRRNTLGVLFGDGRGSFTRGPVVRLESGRDRYWYALGDLDEDGRLDVATASSASDAAGADGRLVVQSGDGSGGFSQMPGHPITLPAAAGPVSIADLDRDGRTDIAVAHPDATVSILLNRGRGAFVPAPGSPVHIGSRTHALVVRDVNADARPDLIAATGDRVAVLLATHSGYAPAPGSPFPAGPGAYSLTVHDVNADGKLDIAASAFEGEAVTLLLGR